MSLFSWNYIGHRSNQYRALLTVDKLPLKSVSYLYPAMIHNCNHEMFTTFDRVQ